ncbi:alpha/beta hydrolase [Streptomyces sp. SAJ15]|uniref:alpha/beta hydrolase n=1 Tax=Streptomyces sp. SAJ15 TaxID=2011095 RepID=UPI001184C824|nr:alpha/beta hydrolase [Streptomyces sp. SAJ15]TVL93518.1 hypothetical protein CD790_00115 [Streptomyces sp. SAJ15]
MPINRRRSTLLAAPLVAAAALASTLVAAPGAGAAAPGAGAAAPAPASSLDWTACAPDVTQDPRLRCAEVAVPLDYDRPRGEQITLTVSRLRSERPESRRGVLLMIPGGPGGSSLDGPVKRGAKLPQSVRDAYDVVGFAPRGLTHSTPVSCELPTASLTPVALRPWPAADGSIERNVAFGRSLADSCARNGDKVLRSISTRTEARDIDRIRQALGERKLSAWGVSYGTYAGAVYAQLFPHRTDRWVLDSSGDPDPKRVGRGWLANYSRGVEDAFPDFAHWAAQPGEFRLAETPEEVRPLFLKLAAQLDREPIPWKNATPAELNGDVLRTTLLDGLYTRDRFPRIAQLMLAAQGKAELPAAAPLPVDVLQSTTAVSAATLCNDVSWPRSLSRYQRDVAADRERYPLTAGMPVNVMTCAFWDAPQQRPVRVTDEGPSNVLMIQNLRDPSTPHAGGLRMRRALGDRARLVTVDAVGHGSYVNTGNACGDRTVTDYLVNGERPAHDTVC